MFMEFINLKVEVSVWLILKISQDGWGFSYNCFEGAK